MLKNSRCSNQGFTLIELVMTIAIIGLLASMVLAALADTRREARNTQRIADAKQLQNAVELYRNSIGSYPCNRDDGSGSCTGTAATIYVNDSTPPINAPTTRLTNFRTDLSAFVRTLNDSTLSGDTTATNANWGSIHYDPVAGRQSYSITVYFEGPMPTCTLSHNDNDC